MVFDTVLIVAALAFLLAVCIVAFGDAQSGRVFLAGAVAILVLYEPLSVSWLGGTIGHRRNNLRVISDANGGNPALLRSFIRYIIKVFLGLPSFVAMMFTARHQAVHDRLTRTTVQFRDINLAHDSDIAFEREIAPSVGLPSRIRRIVVIALYEVLLLLAVSLTQAFMLSSACAVQRLCSSGEQLLSSVLGFGWMVGSVVCIVLGWRGRLFGARSDPTYVGASAT